MAIATCNVVVPVFSTPTCRKMRSKERDRYLRTEGRVIAPAHRRSLQNLAMCFRVSRRARDWRGLRHSFYATSDPVIPPRTAIFVTVSRAFLLLAMCGSSAPVLAQDTAAQEAARRAMALAQSL